MADKKDQLFSIDSDQDGAEVPTLTKLLYRKKLVKTLASPGSGRQGRGLDAGISREQDQSRIMTLEPTHTVERPSPEAIARMPLPAPVAAEPVSSPFVVSQLGSNRAQPTNMGSATKGSSDRRIMPSASPFTMPDVIRPKLPARYAKEGMAGAGILALNEKAKIEASLVFEDAGESFKLRSIVTASLERVTLWSGMEIPKTVFSDLIGRLKKFGFAEFSTLGATGSGNFDRTTFRSAFQAKNAEWITLIGVKNAAGSDGIVAVLSPGSIQMHLPAFHSAGMPAAGMKKAA